MSCGAEAAWIYQASKPNVNGAFVQVLENVACFATCSAHSFFCWREGVLNRYSCILILLEGLLLSVFHLTRALALCVLTRNRPWHMCGEFQYAAHFHGLSQVCCHILVFETEGHIFLGSSPQGARDHSPGAGASTSITTIARRSANGGVNWPAVEGCFFFWGGWWGIHRPSRFFNIIFWDTLTSKWGIGNISATHLTLWTFFQMGWKHMKHQLETPPGGTTFYGAGKFQYDPRWHKPHWIFLYWGRSYTLWELWHHKTSILSPGVLLV